MARRRLPLHLAVPVLLMATVAVLAALQYRWLGRVSEAERARMHETMTARAESLAEDLDHEVARLYVAFQLQRAELDALAPALARRYAEWRATAEYPTLVRGIYLARPDGSLEAFDPGSATLAPADWPDDPKPLSGGVQQETVSAGTASVSIRLPRPVTTHPLAVSTLLPFEGPGAAHPDRPPQLPGVVIVRLDDDVVTQEILPALTAKHFGDSLGDYRMRIVDTTGRSSVVYRPAGDNDNFNANAADVSVEA